MKKKVALSATAIAVLASAVPAQVAPVEAAADNSMDVVHTKYITGNQSSHTGDGTVGSPFNLFEDAIKKVADGGTIIIHNAAFLNEVTKNNLPFIIDKNITIKSADGQHNTLEVRTPGIILGDNVKFENINLDFTNGFHDAIFANGHRLDLINVTKSPNTREIDLFAGTLYMGPYENLVLEPGTKGVINVEGGTYLNGKNDSKFGNIYAGSMNGNFEGTADITVSRNDATKKVIVGTIYGSGALQSTYNPDHFIGTTEPEAPEAMPDNFTVSGDVNVNLNDYQVPVDGATGTNAKTKVYTNSRNGNDLALKNVDTLEVNGGKVNLVSFRDESLRHINNIKLVQDTVLGFSGVNRDFTVNTYEGNGTIILRNDAKVTIANQITQGNTLNLAVNFYFNGTSDPALEDHVYAVTPKGSSINFTPHNTQSAYGLYAFEEDSQLQWKFVKTINKPIEPQPDPDIPEGDDEELELPKITGFIITDANKNINKEVADFVQHPTVTIPFSVNTEGELEDYIFLEDYPDFNVSVEGHDVKPHEDESGNPCYYVQDLNMYIYLQPNVLSDEFNEQEILVEFKDETGTPVPPKEDTYKIDISAGTHTLNTTLVIGDEEEPGGSADGGDDPDGDDEENGEVGPDTPALTKPSVSGFKESSYLEVHKGQATQISKEFQVEYKEPITEQVEFQDLANTQVFLGQDKIEYDTAKGGYPTNDGFTLKITTTETGKYTATFKAEDDSQLPVGKKEFRLVADQEEATLAFEVKPAITALTSEDTKVKEFEPTAFLGQESQQPFFTFKVTQSHAPTTLDKYEDFELFINEESTEKHDEGGKVYYHASQGMVKAHIKYNEQEENYELYLETYDGTSNIQPELNQYTVKLSYPEINDLTFTANVKPKEEEPAPDEPDTNPTDNYMLASPQKYADGVTVTYEESINGVETGFLILTKDNTPVDSEFKDLGIDFEFGASRELGVYREDTDDYYFASHKVKAKVEKESADIYKVIFTQLNEKGDPTNFTPATYGAVVGNNISYPARLEFTVTPPSTPGPSEPSDEDKVIVESIDVTENYDGLPEITNGQPFNFTYNVQVTTTENRIVNISDFNFSHFGSVAVQQGNTGVYTIQESGITLEVTKLEGDNNFQVVMSGESTNLLTASQSIFVGINGSDKTDDLTFFVVNPPLKATNIKVPESTSLVVGETNRAITIPIEMTLSRKDSVNKLDYTITLNNQELNSDGNGEYLDPQTGLQLMILPEGETGYRIYIAKLDENGIHQYLDEGEYHFKATSDISDDFEFKLVVNPDPLKVVDANIEKGQRFTPEQAKSGVKVPLKLNFNKSDVGNLDFTTLGYTVFINDKEATLDGDTYKLVDFNLNVTFLDEGNGNYKVFLFKTDDEGQIVQLPEDVYSIHTDGLGNGDFNLFFSVEEPTPTPDVPSGGGSGSTTPTPKPDPVEPTPTPQPPTGDKEEEPKPEPEKPSSGTTPTPPPTQQPSGGNTGGSASGGGTGTTPSQPSGGSTGTTTPSQPSGGTNLPVPDPKPEKPVEQPPTVTPQPAPTPVPPQQEVTRPTVKPGAIASAVEALEDLADTIKGKVDSLLTEVIEQAKGLVLDLTGDKDDLSSVSTLDITKDGIFANVDGERVKFASDLKLNDMSKLRITRTDGSPIPYKTDGTGFTITTHNFSDILITERVVEPFVDVAKDDWFQPYVDEMYNRGITTGTTATSFSPNASITRAQLAALLARTYELKPTGEKPVLTDTADQWYAADVQALVDLGIIKGYGDGTFRGDEPITREHLAMMLQRLAEKLGKDANHVKESNFTDTAKMSAEGKSAIQWAAEQGIINSGQGTAFKPKSNATRAQVAKMLTLFINK